MTVFFKQKTAYEMLISDWSSDVCSSDLNAVLLRRNARSARRWTGRGRRRFQLPRFRPLPRRRDPRARYDLRESDLWHAADRHGRRWPLHRQPARNRQADRDGGRSEEHTSELQSLMRISYAVFCLKKKKKQQ